MRRASSLALIVVAMITSSCRTSNQTRRRSGARTSRVLVADRLFFGREIPVFVIEVFHDRTAGFDASLVAIAEEVKKRFGQEAVLRVSAIFKIRFL